MKDVDGNSMESGDIVYWREMGMNDGVGFNNLGIVIGNQQYGNWIDIEDIHTQKKMTKYAMNLRKAPIEIQMLWKLENL